MNTLDKDWEALINRLEKQFDDEMTLKGILYLIGIQSLTLQNVLAEKKN